MSRGTLIFVFIMATVGRVGPAVAERGVDVPLAQPFDLKIGEQVTIAGEDLEIGFSEVLKDSRCPRDVQCFWAGVATINVWVEKRPGKRETFTLHVPNADAPASYGKYSVLLKDVKPYPEADRRHPREDYVATLVVELAK